MFEIDERILSEMASGTPRASVIVGHAHVEEECQIRLRHLLLDDSAAFDAACQSGFLQSHVARVNLLHLLGFIGTEVRDDLKVLAKIRNEFAHNSHVNDFTYPVVMKNISRIKLLNVTTSLLQRGESDPPPMRKQFEFCIGNAVAILRRRTPRLVV